MEQGQTAGDSTIPHRRWKQRWWFKALLIAATLLFCLTATEMDLRWVLGSKLIRQREEMAARMKAAREFLDSQDANYPFAAHPSLVLHPYLGYTLKPNLSGTFRLSKPTRLETDRYGFRNSVQDYEALTSATFVVGVFGDSAVVGDGIDGNENTMPSRLGQLLQERTGRDDVCVLNFGMEGWHNPQQFIALTRTLSHLDLAVTCDGVNDFFSPYYNVVRGGKDPRPLDFPSLFEPRVMSPLLSPDLAIATLRLKQFDAAYRPGSFQDGTAIATWVRYSILRSKQMALELLAAREPQRIDESEALQQDVAAASNVPIGPWLRYAVGEWLAYAERGDAVAATRSVPVLHVLQPYLYAYPGEKVPPGLLADLATQVQDMPAAWQTMRDGAAQWHASRIAAGIPESRSDFLDLSVALAADPANWLDSVHPSPQGAQQVAERIAERLLANGMIPPAKP